MGQILATSRSIRGQNRAHEIPALPIFSLTECNATLLIRAICVYSILLKLHVLGQIGGLSHQQLKCTMCVNIFWCNKLLFEME